MLAVLSLALSGVFSIILVISRTPQLIEHFPWMKDLFAVSLVVHVDLSVLVWFLAMTGVIWSMLIANRPDRHIPFAQPAAFGAMLAGLLLLALSPLEGEWLVHKSNYIPVIENLWFFSGLALIASSVTIASLQTLLAPPADTTAVGWCAYLASPILLLALFCFALTGFWMPEGIRGIGFYEHVFWAGGHVLQFVYMQIMLVAWLVLAAALSLKEPPREIMGLVIIIGPVAASWALIPFLLYEVTSQEFMDFYSLQMNIGLGIGGIMLGLWLISQWVRQQGGKANRPAYSGVQAALASSLLLFWVGGAFGVAINGPNVRIPAHYHGSIVAITLALMGLAYYLLPKMGGAAVTHWKAAKIQPWLYGIGQLLHISGLAISGGYGVIRKAVGDVGQGGWEVKAALGMMGGGGLIAITGGLLFVIIMVMGFRRCQKPENVE